MATLTRIPPSPDSDSVHLILTGRESQALRNILSYVFASSLGCRDARAIIAVRDALNRDFKSQPNVCSGGIAFLEDKKTKMEEDSE